MIELKIYIPPNNLPEVSYIIDTFFNDLLGLKHKIEIRDNIENYIICVDGKELYINATFFKIHPEQLSYLNSKNIPFNVKWFNAYPLSNEQIPIIYGEDKLIICQDNIYCGLDIFASSFFMLTRWEEIVISKKDNYGRCLESEMFVVKHNLFKRPIVNEYCSLLKDLLLLLDPTLEIKQNSFKVLLTHDIDYLFRYGSFLSLTQNLAGDILHRKSLRLARKTLRNYFKYKKGSINDPFDTFDELMDLSESIGLKSSFYFKPTLAGEFDATYSIKDKRVVDIIKHIHERGHEVGIHPSENTFHNEKQFYIECDRIRSIGIPIMGGRQHFLLYDFSETFNYWENAGLEYDSGLGFYERIGFRCGICCPFKMFDVKRRETLNLIQKPLCVMDAALMRKRPKPIEMLNEIIHIIDIIKKYKGLFVFLWHNDRFNREEYCVYNNIYEETIIKCVE